MLYPPVPSRKLMLPRLNVGELSSSAIVVATVNMDPKKVYLDPPLGVIWNVSSPSAIESRVMGTCIVFDICPAGIVAVPEVLV